MSALAPIVSRLKPLIRLLSSNQEGEIVAAARALNRLLQANNADIHILADSIDSGTINKDDIKRLYDAGFEHGLRAGESKRHGAGDFHNVDGMPSWHAIALFCQERDDRLRSSERQFVHDVAAWTVWREPSCKQQKWLKSIFFRLGGKP